MLKDLWDKFKGSVAGTLLTILFGLGVVVTYTGLEVVDCPAELNEGSICLEAVIEETVEEETTTE